ncbi:hypothetical protein KIW84_015722 [Lathyrus oleraceus]|uniref:Reverse transcriptase RNase H-like domain-containing protein n=1 Tax=Pisum sativum TaxID=3888 RepID=A0A9D5H0X9_PEA|nr:hypothetical protein KIW84_015722 [Pisum sativum]
MFLAHTHVTICRSISTLDPVGNDSATVHYDFENPIYQAEDGSEEDCEVPGELARLLQEEKTIQPHEESIEIVNLGTEINKKEVRGFLGHSNYIARFIPHLTATCKPIFKLLRQNQEMVWNDECQEAYDKIRKYRQEPPVPMPPVEGRPLITYLTVLENSMRYSQPEKACCALAWAARRLRQYMLNHTTLLTSKMDSIKYLFEKPAVS